MSLTKGLWNRTEKLVTKEKNNPNKTKNHTYTREKIFPEQIKPKHGSVPSCMLRALKVWFLPVHLLSDHSWKRIDISQDFLVHMQWECAAASYHGFTQANHAFLPPPWFSVTSPCFSRQSLTFSMFCKAYWTWHTLWVAWIERQILEKKYKMAQFMHFSECL